MKTLAVCLCLLAWPALASEPLQIIAQSAPIQFPKHPFTPIRPPKADPNPSTPLGDLANFLGTVAVPDLQNALALANSQTPPDVTAAQCWNGLIPVVQQIQAQINGVNGPSGGIATGVQIARDLLNAPTSPMIKQVNLACAALYMDTKIGILNFATNFGGMLAGAAILAPIKPLPLP